VNVVDLHPENLFDKERRGQLAVAERERLEAHLASCSTCRLERLLQADFALELSTDGVAPEVAALAETVAKDRVRSGGSRASARGRRARVTLLAAAISLTLVVGAFASTEGGRRVLAPLLGRTAAPASEERGDVAAPGPAFRHGPVNAPVNVPPAAAPEPRAVTAPSALAPDPPPAVAMPEPSVRPLPVDPLTELFETEAAARRRGDFGRVLDLHAQLVARYPQSHEAQVSRMMVGRMLLDRGDAARALSAFEAYLRAGSGELREDALAGRANALDALGHDDEARSAWMTLLDQYPGTAYAAHARARTASPGGD
jgi:TolA-binding protein